jgi:hypothetical protein
MLTACGLVVLALAVYVPAGAVSGPSALTTPEPDCHGPLTSWIEPLSPFSPKDVWINFTVNGSSERNRLRWTELWYQESTTDAWVLYAPPWNPTGRWVLSGGKDHADGQEDGHHGTAQGTIIFDTTFTGGDGAYNLTTVAVGRHHQREPGPPDEPATVKANTTVDSRPPTLFIPKPTPGSWTMSEWLDWLAVDDGSGVASVTISVDGKAPQTFATATGSMNMSLAEEGPHTVTVTAADWAGNAVTILVSFNYDREAPSLQITAPEPSEYFSTSSVDVEWTVSDEGGIASLLLSVDNAAPVNLSNTTTSYALVGLAETTHVVGILAVDIAGNFASQMVSFSVDSTPPSVEIVSPTDGAYSNSHDLQAVWMGIDHGSGIDRYEVSLDGSAPIALRDTAGYVFPETGEGEHTITVTAYDRAGNAAEANATVSVDYTLPTIQVTDPEQGATVYGDVQVNWTASDAGSGIAAISVAVDGASTPVPPDTDTLALAPLSEGPHAVTVRIWDHAGNSNERTVAFLYGGQTPPGGPGTSGLPMTEFWIIMLIIAAIAVGSAYAAVRRHRRKTKP